MAGGGPGDPVAIVRSRATSGGRSGCLDNLVGPRLHVARVLGLPLVLSHFMKMIRRQRVDQDFAYANGL